MQTNLQGQVWKIRLGQGSSPTPARSGSMATAPRGAQSSDTRTAVWTALGAEIRTLQTKYPRVGLVKRCVDCGSGANYWADTGLQPTQAHARGYLFWQEYFEIGQRIARQFLAERPLDTANGFQKRSWIEGAVVTVNNLLLATNINPTFYAGAFPEMFAPLDQVAPEHRDNTAYRYRMRMADEIRRIAPQVQNRVQHVATPMAMQPAAMRISGFLEQQPWLGVTVDSVNWQYPHAGGWRLSSAVAGVRETIAQRLALDTWADTTHGRAYSTFQGNGGELWAYPSVDLTVEETAVWLEWASGIQYCRALNGAVYAWLMDLTPKMIEVTGRDPIVEVQLSHADVVAVLDGSKEFNKGLAMSAVTGLGTAIAGVATVNVQAVIGGLAQLFSSALTTHANPNIGAIVQPFLRMFRDQSYSTDTTAGDTYSAMRRVGSSMDRLGQLIGCSFVAGRAGVSSQPTQPQRPSGTALPGSKTAALVAQYAAHTARQTSSTLNQTRPSSTTPIPWLKYGLIGSAVVAGALVVRSLLR